MIKCFTDSEFSSATSKTLLKLKCIFCDLEFTKSKKRIIEKFDKDNPLSGGFCSTSCWSNYRKRISTTPKECSNCKKKIIVYNKELKEKNFCSLTCSASYFNSFRKVIKVPVIKNVGGIKFIKPKRVKKINKCLKCNCDTHNEKYCGGTCRNLALNKFIRGNKSYAERVLVRKLKSEFLNWTIIENDRIILNGLELDIYIPNIKMGIEWNGIYHLKPIQGDEKFQKVVKNDTKKLELCHQLGITLLVICDLTSHKKFIEETTDDIITKLKMIELAV